MKKVTSLALNILVVLTMTLGNYSSAGASTSDLSEGQQKENQSRPSVSMVGNPLPFGQPTTNWNLVFADEFSGTTLDLTKWRPNWLGATDTSITKPVNSSEVSCYDPKQVAVNNGELDLTAVQRTCSSWNYASGLIESNGRFNFTYGYMEARIWTPAGAGMWPAFWTDGQNWPTDGEIDILEAYGTDRSTYHYHYAGCGGNCGPGGEVNITGATAGWHVYAADWEPGSITWYYDGQQVWQYTTGIVSVPHYLILNLGLKSAPAAVPATLRVDYVRVWKSAGTTPLPTVTNTALPPTAVPTFTSTSVPTLPPTVAPTQTALPPTSAPTFTSTSVPTIPPTATPTSIAVTETSIPTFPSATPTSPIDIVPAGSTSEIVFDDQNPALVYSSGWHSVSDSRATNGSYMITNQKGAFVTLPFTGEYVSIIYTSNPTYRSVQVYVDDTLVGTINEKTKRIGFKKRWDIPTPLTFGNHTLKLVFVGGKRTNIQASLDAVIVR